MLFLERELIMRMLALMGLICGMGILIAQEPAPQKQDEPKKERKEGRRPFGGEKGKGPFAPPSFKSMLDKFDKNKDGALSKDEVDGKMWDRLGKADKDMDGKVTEKEFADNRKAMLDKALGKKGDGKKKD